MIASKQVGVFLIVSAPSGCGKTSIKNQLMKTGQFQFSVSYTTRKPREGEVDGQDYHFITVKAFEDKRASGGFLESAEVHGAFYGTGIETLENLQKGQDVLLDIDIQGGTQVKHKFSDSVSVFVLPPSWSALQDRLQKRGTEEQSSVELRLNNAQEEILEYHKYDYLVVNDSLEQAVDDIIGIVNIEHKKTIRLEVDIDAFYKS
jgi:guanylate kinase